VALAILVTNRVVNRFIYQTYRLIDARAINEFAQEAVRREIERCFGLAE